MKSDILLNNWFVLFFYSLSLNSSKMILLYSFGKTAVLVVVTHQVKRKEDAASIFLFHPINSFRYLNK